MQIDERAQAEEPAGRGEDGTAKGIRAYPQREDLLGLDDVQARREIDGASLAVGGAAGGIDLLVQLEVAARRHAHIAAEAAEVG